MYVSEVKLNNPSRARHILYDICELRFSQRWRFKSRCSMLWRHVAMW